MSHAFSRILYGGLRDTKEINFTIYYLYIIICLETKMISTYSEKRMSKAVFQFQFRNVETL